MSTKTDETMEVLLFIKMGLGLALSFADMAKMLTDAGYTVPMYEEVEQRLAEMKALEDLPTD